MNCTLFSIGALGGVDLFGQAREPTHTQLAVTAKAGDNVGKIQIYQMSSFQSEIICLEFFFL